MFEKRNSSAVDIRLAYKQFTIVNHFSEDVFVTEK